MTRYLVQRNFGQIDDEHLELRARRSKTLIETDFTQIVWEHSHVVASPDGTMRTFCIYRAPDEGSIRDHADALGGHQIEVIYEIGGDVSPSDFTS
jgi:Nickel responsive protein SCO4226-like